MTLVYASDWGLERIRSKLQRLHREQDIEYIIPKVRYVEICADRYARSGFALIGSIGKVHFTSPSCTSTSPKVP